MVSKLSVLVVNVLDVGEMGTCNELSNSDKGKIVMATTRSEHHVNCTFCGVLPVRSGDLLPTVLHGGTNHNIQMNCK